MRKNRKILAVLLTLALALSLLPTAAFASGGTCTEADHAAIGTEGTKLENVTATEESKYDCTEITYLQDCIVCSVCGKVFEDKDGTMTEVADTSAILVEAKADHAWTTGACTNKINNKDCKATCDHSGDTDKTDTTCSICGATVQPENPPSEATDPSITGTAAAKSAGSNQFDVSYKYTAGTGDKAVAAETVTFSFVLKDGSTAVTEGATVPQDATGEANKTDYTAALTVPEGTTAKTYTLTITATASNKAVATVDVTVSYAPTGTNPPAGTLTAPTVTYAPATKTVTWSTVPDGVTDVTIGLYSTAPSDGTLGTAVTGFTKKTGATGTSYVLTATELGDPAVDLTGKYIGVTFTKGEETKTGYSAAISSEDPGPGPGPDPTNPISNVRYSDGFVTWTYEGNADFTLTVKRGETTIQDAAPVVDTVDGTTHKAPYTLPVTTAGTVYTFIVGTGEFTTTGTYTVPTPIVPPADTNDAKADAALDSTVDAVAGAENMTKTEAQEAISDIKSATATLSTDETSKEKYSEALVGNSSLVNNIKKLEEKAEITVTANNSAIEEITTTTVVGLGLSATGSTATLTVKPSTTTNPVIPSNANKNGSLVFAMEVGGVATKLNYPAVITINIPAAIKAAGSHYHVYHYVNGKPSWIPSTNNGTNITFATWGFSDFAIVASNSANGDPDAGSSGSNTPNKGSSSTGGGKVTVTTPSTTTPSVTVTASGFSDVPDTHTFSAEIKWAKDNGYMNGTGEGVFSPAGTVNRQQIWMVLARMAGANPANMAEALTWAVENGISDGTNPTGAVSRQQLVTMMFRFAQKQENAPSEAGADISTFSDAAQVSGYAQEALAWSVANNIVGGTADGRLNPYGNATRGAFAAILYRYYN